MHSIKSGLVFAIPVAFALTVWAAPQQSHAASICQKVRGLPNKGCVRTRDIRKGTVRAKHIKTGAVTADKLTAEALAGGRRPIEDCGTIDQPGSYVLLNDLPGSLGLNVDGGCLVIEADDVTLDLAGFNIVGDGTGDPARGDGVSMDNRSNVTIRNGTIRNFVDEGIHGNSEPGPSRNHRVSDIQAIANGGSGIRLEGSRHQVTNCLANENGGDGIDVSGRSTVTGNTVSENGINGIEVGENGTAIGNTANGNGESGINATESGATVAGNMANGNGEDGIRTQADTSVTGNIAKGNTGFGVNPGSDSAVAGNVATGNNGGGIGGNIDTCTGCSFAGNLPAVP